MDTSKLKILYQDGKLIAVYKPPWILVHRSKECIDKDNLLKQVRNSMGQFVYPLHRLDRAVSGIVVFAKDKHEVKNFQQIWHTPKIRKFYIALTRGLFHRPCEFNFPLKDTNKVKKESLTRFWPLIRYKSATLVEVEILTGRHHQIRRHFARRVDHLLGDRKYGKKKYNDYYLTNFKLERIFLHAHYMRLELPYNKKVIEIRCPLSDDLLHTLKLLKAEYVETLSQSSYISLDGY